MKTLDRIYLDFARIMPDSFRASFQKQMVYAGMKDDADTFLGRAFLVSFLYALVAVFSPFAIYGEFRLNFVLAALGLLVVGFFLGNMQVYFKAEDRSKQVEENLPDTFQMIAANLRAGMTPFKALKSLKGSSGVLEEEIEYVTSRALGTESFGENLLKISERIKSDTLDKSMKLFTTSMRSGGRLATLLEELAVDISETQSLKNELKTSTKTYTAFILFTILIGTPLLLAIAVNFVKMMENMQSKSLGVNADFGLGNLMGAVTITPGFLTQIALALLIMTAILASMLMGTINEGKPMSGLRMAPVIMGGCIICFYVAGYVVGSYILGLG